MTKLVQLLISLIIIFGLVNADEVEQQDELPTTEASPLLLEIQGTFTNDKSDIVIQDSIMQYEGQSCTIQEVDEVSLYLPDCGEITVNILREETRLIGLGIAEDVYVRKVEKSRDFLDMWDPLFVIADKIKKEKLDSLINGMSTGDLLLSHGMPLNDLNKIESYLVSHAMEVAMNCYWTQSAVILKEPSKEILQKYGVNEPNESLFVFGINQGQTEVPYIKSLKTWLRLVGSGIAYRKLNWKDAKKAKDIPELNKVLNDAFGRAYETNRVEMILALIDANWVEDLSTIYSSELVMWTYRSMGLVSSNLVASNWPVVKLSHYFRTSDAIADELKNHGVATIEPEVRLINTDSAPNWT